MKKAVVMAVCSMSGALARAQSSVTLYGTVDESIQYTNNQDGTSSWAMSQGGLGSSKQVGDDGN